MIIRNFIYPCTASGVRSRAGKSCWKRRGTQSGLWNPGCGMWNGSRRMLCWSGCWKRRWGISVAVTMFVFVKRRILKNIRRGFTGYGRGPIDFRVSWGGDKTIVEVKLSTNTQYLHGYEEQVEEYGKAECTDKMIYVFVDLGNPGRLKKITETHQLNLQSQKKVPELMIIDATAKNAASTYSNWNIISIIIYYIIKKLSRNDLDAFFIVQI